MEGDVPLLIPKSTPTISGCSPCRTRLVAGKGHRHEPELRRGGVRDGLAPLRQFV